MKGYAYYFSDEVWLGVDPTIDGYLDPLTVAKSNLKHTTRHGIIINHSCDGLVAFGLKDYAPFSSEENEENRESNYDSNILPAFVRKRTGLMNAHYICLKASIMDRIGFSAYSSWISPNSIMNLIDINDFSQGGGTKRKFDRHRYIANNVQKLNPKLALYLTHTMGHRSYIVDKNTIIDSVERFEKICDRKNDGGIKLGSLVNLAICSIEDHE